MAQLESGSQTGPTRLSGRAVVLRPALSRDRAVTGQQAGNDRHAEHADDHAYGK